MFRDQVLCYVIGSLAKIYVKTGEDEVACGVEAKNSDGKINVGGQHDKSKCARMIKRKCVFFLQQKPYKGEFLDVLYRTFCVQKLHDKSKCARMIKRKRIFQVARKTMFATKSTK